MIGLTLAIVMADAPRQLVLKKRRCKLQCTQKPGRSLSPDWQSPIQLLATFFIPNWMNCLFVNTPRHKFISQWPWRLRGRASNAQHLVRFLLLALKKSAAFSRVSWLFYLNHPPLTIVPLTSSQIWGASSSWLAFGSTSVFSVMNRA